MLVGPQLRNHLDKNFTLGNYFFGLVKPTKNADLDKYKYRRKFN